MRFILLIIVSYIIGFFTAIPIGATQVEIAKRSMTGYIKEALMVVAGSITSDLMYGFIAMFGIAPFLKDEKVEAFFWLIGGIILIVLGVFTLIYNDKDGYNNTEKTMLFKSHTSLLVGFSLAVTNPPIIFCGYSVLNL
ncbi:LysE family transporter [Hippea maritima]|uniref:Lysine exporter protein (LYSE/YGGA) n=1 Tax=Hippea maritima (strain ATCC 700847 / DSM 10411 / MH2) TaxID=760142 RepID=F2LXH6_HIPMA|nr:LysE family transporter [Hippea maritima]AEA33162.1 Lysine exporter protein (LYSE/YGGA) [Hippea maritima DSM 10411]